MFDWLIQHARIADGSGGEPYPGDVAAAEGRIAAVGHLTGQPAAHVLDAAGRLLTPGFVDIHRHGDAALFRPDFGLLELAQGITTVVNGCCGMSAAPLEPRRAEEIAAYTAPVLGPLPPERRFADLGAYFRAAAALPLRINVGQQAGMGVLRAGAAGFAPGDLDPEALRALHRALERALGDGAIGVSLGLGYAPECFYSPAGLLAALAPLRGSGTVISVHMRQEGDGVEAALEEMLAAARALDTPVEISHLKAIGRRNWGGAAARMLRRIARAREEGADVTCDVYPYTAGSTQLIHVLPPECADGGTEALTARLRDSAFRAELRRRIETGTDFENILRLCGAENVRATGLREKENLPFEGRSLAELAAARGGDVCSALFDLLVSERCAPAMIDFITDEADIARILRAPFASAVSDAIYPAAGLAHPRLYGMAPHLFAHFVFRRGDLSLGEAVNRLTLRPAARYGLAAKGRIVPGADADLCLFDPASFCETGTFDQPARYARGMDWVFVGGVPAVAEGHFTAACAGRLL